MPKITAVEWLEEELTKNGFNFQNYQDKIEEAKVIEEENIIDAIIYSENEHFIQSNCYPPQFVIDKAKRYYKQTFKNDLQD